MKHLSIAAAVCLILFVAAGYATAPQLIDYQGLLTDNLGNPVADGSYSVTFTIYDDSLAGSSIWAETQSVNTTNGVFSIKLGAVNPIHDSVFADTMRYLGVAVSPDPEMTPRARLVTVPYAYRAATIDGASGGELSSSVWWTEELATFDDEPMMYLFNPSPAGPVDRKVIMRSPTEPNFGLYYNTTSESFQFKLGSSILTIAMTAGRVGVGTDNPASEMDIVGTIRAQGVEMGLNPTRSGNNSTVGGGSLNSATANWATAAGGLQNTASGQYAAVSGGSNNESSGEAGTVPGGTNNTAAGKFAFAAGHRAKANHAGTFVWADSSESNFSSTADEQFLIRASGGVGINTNAPQAELDVAGDVSVSGNITIGGDIIGSAPPWTAFPFNTGFEDWETAHPGNGYQRVQYRKIGDIVYLRGTVHKTAHTPIFGEIIGVLPVGFRPPASVWQQDFPQITITINGSVLVSTSEEIAPLDGFFFSTTP